MLLREVTTEVPIDLTEDQEDEFTEVRLFEMPKEINATEFNLDDQKVNRRVATDFRNGGELLETEDVEGGTLSLCQKGNSIALIFQPEDAPIRLLYMVRWKEIFHKFVGHKAITQVAVWRDKLSAFTSAIAPKIFWEYLLPQHEVLMTDALQTPDGRTFWMRRVAEAFDHHLRVYYLNLLPSAGGQPRELIEIRSKGQFEKLAAEKEFWGREDLHRTRKIIISDIELK